MLLTDNDFLEDNTHLESKNDLKMPDFFCKYIKSGEISIFRN